MMLLSSNHDLVRLMPFLPIKRDSTAKNTVAFSNYASTKVLFRVAYRAYEFYSNIYWSKKKRSSTSLSQDNFLGIEIGGGETPARSSLGYLNCDIRNLPSVDIKCHAKDIGQYFDENSIDIIYARHFLEHLTWEELDSFL